MPNERQGAIQNNRWGCKLREGLYKVEFHTVHGTGNGVIYATSGKLRGGNSGFAFTGSYADKGDEILALQLPGVAFKAVLTRIGD